MASILNERYEIIDSQPVTDEDITRLSYKARVLPKSEDGQEPRLVWLDLLPPEADTPSVRAAADRAASLPISSNILLFYGLSELSGEPGIQNGVYLVSEFTRGISLRERIRRVAPFSLAVSLDIAISICHALIRSETAGYPHLALKPEYVVLTPEGLVKVGEFQIAAAVYSALGRESFNRDDRRAVGLILYEMLTGVAPDQLDVANDHSPKALNSGVPPALDGIVKKATRLDTARQYTDISQILTDLQNAREDLKTGKSLGWSPLGASSNSVAGRTAAKAVPANPKPLADADENTMMKTGRMERDTEEYEESDYPVWGKFLLMVLGVIVLGLVFAGAYLFTMFSVPSDIVVPNLIGKQFSDAQKIAQSGHFNLVKSEDDYSDVLPAGSIYQEDPAPGRSIKAGKDVSVSVSDGPRLITVPDLSQMTLGRATETLAQSGLPQGTITYNYDEAIAKGIVVSEEPTASSNIAHDTPVNIVVSKGPPPPGAPTGLSATSSLDGEIDLTWNDDPDAVTYNIYRDGVKLQSGLPQAAYSDVNLQPGESHSYTVTGVNENGESTQSDPAKATTMIEGAPPVEDTAPPTDNSDNSSSAPIDPSAPKQRRFEIRFRVPSNGPHNCQIEVQDTTGTNIVYDQDRDSDDIVDDSVIGFGNKIIFRIFIDGKLIRQDTK